MKKISEHLGQIIVALACVALIISAVVLFKAPIGDFYDNIVNKEVAVGNKVLTAIDNTDVSGLFNGGEGGAGEGEEEEPAPDVIPQNATYYVGVTSTTTGDYTGATSVLNAGDPFPATVNNGDVYIYDGYEYRYGYEFLQTAWSSSGADGWGVAVINQTQNSYPVILQSINGKPIKSTACTFYNCTSLTSLPDGFTIPSGVTNVMGMFYECTTLTALPDGFTIPNGVTNTYFMFGHCTFLTSLPDGFAVPSSATNLSSMFCGCVALASLPDGFTIPNGAVDISYMFHDCVALTSLPDGFSIPNGVTNVSYMLSDCEGLTSLPDGFTIPNGVTDVSYMFNYCKVLTGLPDGFTIPDGVTAVSRMFAGCEALISLPDGFTIPSGVTSVYMMFTGCKALTGLPDSFVIPNGVTDVSYIFDGCSVLTGNVKIDAAPTTYDNCFSNTQNPIKITGSCPLTTKMNLRTTANNGNVTFSLS